MASEPVQPPAALSRELIALIKAVATAEADRDARLETKLAELDAQRAEAVRVEKLIFGGAARREARLRVLEDTVETLAVERARLIAPRPLDLPRRHRFDASTVDMRSADSEPDGRL